MHRIYRGAPLVQEVFFWCTKWTKRCRWCTKRASGVPTRTRCHKTSGSGQRKKTVAEQWTASVLTYAGVCKSITKSEIFFFIPVRFGVWLAVGLSGVCLQPNRKEFIVHLVNALLACHDLPVDQSLDCSLHS